MKILIIKMSSLGDIIHAFPVVDYIKEFYPEADIDWVVEKPFSELLRAHPKLNQIFEVQTKKWRTNLFNKNHRKEIGEFVSKLRGDFYDFIIDLQGNIKSGIITSLAKGSQKVGFGAKTVPEWPNLFVTSHRYNPPFNKNIREDYLFIVQSALKNFQPILNLAIKLKLSQSQIEELNEIQSEIQSINRLKVMVCPGSNWNNKQLSRESLEGFLKLLEPYLNAHLFFIWGSQNEKNLVLKIAENFDKCSTVMERLPMPLLQNVMSQMDLIIAMDSLPLHLAGTTSVKTFSVFGASSANKYKPLGGTQNAMQGQCPYGKTFEKRCSLLRTCSTGACIKNLEGRDIFSEFLNWWKEISFGKNQSK